MQKGPPIRLFSDGCYDLYHYGHANQLLQAKRMGDELVAAVHPDHVITAYKGPPVIKEEERYKIIGSIRWVDEVAENVGYHITPELLDSYHCDYDVHGNDPYVLADGTDPVARMKKEGRYKECQRTEGISTTDIVGRMLLLTSTHHNMTDHLSPDHLALAKDLSTDTSGFKPWVTISQYDPQTNQIQELVKGRGRSSNDRVVFLDGNYDLFHIGHLKFLQEAARRGDYLVVGVHSDRTVNCYKKKNYPIMALHERVLGLLACRYVDEVLISSPYTISQELLDHYNVHIVLHGRSTPVIRNANDRDPFYFPKQMGKFEIIDSGSDMSTSKIMQRIIENRLTYEVRNEKCLAKQKAVLEVILQQANHDHISKLG